jgi:heat shock protein HtpX
MAQLGLTTYRLNNNIKSTALLIAFPFLLLTLTGAIALAFGATQGYGDPADFAVNALIEFWPIVLGIATIWMLIGYFFNGAIIRHATGAVALTRQDQPQLYDIVENLCISRGLAVPKLYIVETDAMNAFASGIDQRSFAITVTRGLLNVLNKDELEAVLAHELTHIMNRDVRLLIVTVVFVGMISFLAQLLWRGMRVMSFRARGKGGLAIIVFVLIAAVISAVGYGLALILRFAISRRREYQADAGSVDLTKNPDALISALLKIQNNPDVPHVPSEVQQLFIENPPSRFRVAGLFDTHPPIDKRIQVLESLGGHVPQPAILSAPLEKPATPPAGPWGVANGPGGNP